MANCELSNLGLEFGDKIKENEQLAGGWEWGEEPFLPEPLTQGRVLGTKRAEKEKVSLGSVCFSLPSMFQPQRVTNCHFN